MPSPTGAHESKPPRADHRPAKLANMSIVKIGHFEVNLGRKLGEGGFGAVYRAKDTSQDPPAECAAKQVKYEKDAGQRAATEREAAFLRKVAGVGAFSLVLARTEALCFVGRLDLKLFLISCIIFS